MTVGMVSELLSLRADMKREEAGDLTEPFRLESQVRTSACLNEQVRNREMGTCLCCVLRAPCSRAIADGCRHVLASVWT